MRKSQAAMAIKAGAERNVIFMKGAGENVVSEIISSRIG